MGAAPPQLKCFKPPSSSDSCQDMSPPNWNTCYLKEWGEEKEELPAIGAGPEPAVSRERVHTPRISTTQIGMQLPDQQCLVHPGRGGELDRR